MNPFAIGNEYRAYGASTFQPVRKVETTNRSTAQPINSQQTPRFLPTVEEMELASQIANGNFSSGLNVRPTQATNPIETRGAAWEGFSVPTNNGTGELIPQYGEGERICDFMA